MKKRKKKPKPKSRSAPTSGSDPKAKQPESTELSAKSGLLFQALPTDRNAKLKLDDLGFPEITFPGRIVLSDWMKDRLFERCKEFWHPGIKGQGPKNIGWIINLLAEPDRYGDALKFLHDYLVRNRMPVFNAPDAVMGTKRDVVWKKLADVENLIAPKCGRFRPTLPQHFQLAFEHFELAYPVLVRPAGSHTGNDLVLIENQDDWAKIYGISWGGREIYMTQWVSFQNAAGEWPKLRVVITPEKVRLRHVLYGDDWLIHAAVRGPEEVEKELTFMKSAESWAALQKLGADIRDRVGLHFFGVDVGVKSDTEFVLFEANASMSILSKTHMPVHRREEYEASLQSIEEDVWRAISNFIARAETAKGSLAAS